MLDTTSCSDNSPFSSPFQSPAISPSSSRGPSPTPTPVASPSLRRLERANSYRKGKKAAAGHIDQFIRRRKLLQCDRSQSDTEISNNDEKKREVKMRRKKKSISHEVIRKSKSANSPESDSYDKHHDGAPDRKKSLSLLIDFKRLMELSPKPLRSHKKTKAVMTSDEEGDHDYDGPLFQATTMFVPGYDFNTKQSTVDRPPSGKGFLSRRGSRDKSFISLLERVHSSPSLIRRGSKVTENTTTTTTAAKSKSKYARCDSTPVAFLKKEDKPFATRKLHSESNISEYLSVSERGAMIAKRHRNFQEKKRPKSSHVEVSHELIPKGNVKKISTTFEDGSIFERNIAERRKEFANNTKSRFSGDYDKVFRHRSDSFENSGEFYRKRSHTCYENYTNKNGSESGYASPTESTMSEASTQLPHPADFTYSNKNHPLINVTSLEVDSVELSNSWSYGQWGDNGSTDNHLLGDGRKRHSTRNYVKLHDGQIGGSTRSQTNINSHSNHSQHHYQQNSNTNSSSSYTNNTRNHQTLPDASSNYINTGNYSTLLQDQNTPLKYGQTESNYTYKDHSDIQIVISAVERVISTDLCTTDL